MTELEEARKEMNKAIGALRYEVPGAVWDDVDKRYRRLIAAIDAEVTHACPTGGSNTTPCCGRTPFELPSTDRMTLDPSLVTCAGV